MISQCEVILLRSLSPAKFIDILESREMKRMSINNCVEAVAYKYGDAPERK